MAVCEWFAGKEILLTGVTSDTGYVVLEKLLRTCPGIEAIYVVLRSKNALNKEGRIKEIFESAGFERVRQECPNAISRLTILEGNLTYDDLGLKREHVALLNDVNVVIHAGGPYDAVLKLCRKLSSLRAAAVATSIFGQRGPVAESLRRERMPEIPLALVRIPAIGPALREPMPGYATVLNGATALMVGAGYAFGDADLPAAILPVDLAANALIASAWDKGTRNEERTVTIYNLPALDCTWGSLINSGRKASEKFPFPSFGIRGMTSRPWLYRSIVVTLEWLPSILCDAFFFAIGRKPRIVDQHLRLRALLQSLEPVLSRSWTTDRNNVYELDKRLTPEDREDFYVRTDIDLETYVLCSAAAVKRLNANDDAGIIANFKRLLVIIVIATFYVVLVR